MAVSSRVDVNGQYLYMQSEIDNAEILVTAPAPGVGWAWVLDQLVYGYSAAPAGPTVLTIEMSGTVCMSIPVIAGGPQVFTPMATFLGDDNGIAAVRLPASGAGATEGFVNVLAHKHRIG